MAPAAVKALITIVDRGRGRSVSAFFAKRFPQLNFLTMGFGTASSEVKALLGLDSSEKDVIFSLIPASVLPSFMQELGGKKFIRSAGTGIAFSLRLTGINSLTQAALCQGETEKTQKEAAMEQAQYSLILVVAEPGYSDKIVQSARAGGATGGTILYGRGIGREEAGAFLGISIQDEREIVAILTPAEQRLSIMQSISGQFGVRTEAKALVLSLPVEDMVQVS